MIQQYPNSQYATDANKRLVYLKDRLAKYELSVAEYYTKRGAYVAVVNRAEQMLREFPDTKATHDVLPLMENAYKQLRSANGRLTKWQSDRCQPAISARRQRQKNKTAASAAVFGVDRFYWRNTQVKTRC